MGIKIVVKFDHVFEMYELKHRQTDFLDMHD